MGGRDSLSDRGKPPEAQAGPGSLLTGCSPLTVSYRAGQRHTGVPVWPTPQGAGGKTTPRCCLKTVSSWGSGFHVGVRVHWLWGGDALVSDLNYLSSSLSSPRRWRCVKPASAPPLLSLPECGSPRTGWRWWGPQLCAAGSAPGMSRPTHPEAGAAAPCCPSQGLGNDDPPKSLSASQIQGLGSPALGVREPTPCPSEFPGTAPLNLLVSSPKIRSPAPSVSVS